MQILSIPESGVVACVIIGVPAQDVKGTFRHTYRLWLDKTGAPLGVQQKLMRHADIRTTMNQYGDSAMSAKRKANSKVVEMVLVRKSSLIDFRPKAEAGAVGAR